MTDSFQIRGTNLELPTDKVVTFEHPISKVLEVGDAIVVLLDSPLNVHHPLNVFGVSKRGDILWRIGKIQGAGRSRYVGLIPQSEDRVRLTDFDGMLVDVEPTTGKVISVE